ncbi:hypothetical protein [Glycomyces harbinensis]|uniref:Peptidase inhibitor family I36 n=1 Tax=Glycomyces harbinensis TaxID=58114 RepID=A0A1G7BCK1_9ACTN|nr:hypothetical protein [Glycomyces harbinensis]SDE24779.1 hypothetical protein SAMN05216270_11678 [Glycomyces harbinensis]
MIRRITTLFVAATAAVLAAVAVPGTASADPSNPGPLTGYVCTSWGCAYFYEQGEWLRVNDKVDDGYFAYAELEVYQNGGWADAPDYVNCLNEHPASDSWCDYDATDGSSVRIHMWREGGLNHTYSSTFTA